MTDHNNVSSVSLCQTHNVIQKLAHLNDWFYCNVAQSQKPVTAYFSSKQLPSFAFAGQFIPNIDKVCAESAK